MNPESESSKIRISELKKTTRGFTLVEILIVLALIGIVAGLAMSNLGGIFGQGKVKACLLYTSDAADD